MSGILSVWRPPFDLRPQVAWLPEGLTLAEMAAAMPGLPHDFAARGVICINGHPVQRNAWRGLRPKPAHQGVPVEVTFHCPPMGGGEDGGGKKVFALIASIALSVVTGGIAAGGAAKFLGAKFVAGTLGAKALAFGTSLAGALILSALSAPPVAKRKSDPAPNEGSAAVDGNVLQANGAIPRVLGERKVFPPLACEPLVYFDGADEVVEAIYCLSGPHRLLNVRIGGAAASDLAGVDVETREGWPGDDRLRLVERQGRTESVQAELRGHLVKDSDGRTLDTSSGDVGAGLPQPYTVVTRAAPDEHWLHLTFPQGLSLNASEATRLRVPLRLRMRPAGTDDWVNLPELHFQAANVRQLRATIALVWTTETTADPQAASGEGWCEARVSSPGQTAAPATDARLADAYFTAGGDGWLAAGNLGSSGVLHVEMTRFTARLLLDPANFPPGRWEIEVVRGAAFREADYNATNYTVGGTVWDLFGYQGVANPRIVRSRDGIADSFYLLRSVSVWNEHPVPTDRLALIAVRARNRELEGLSVLAGGWVRDWDGTDWRAWAVTGNPAPHLRDILAGDLNAKPVPPALIDDDELVDWRTACTTNGWTVNHVSEDEALQDAARIVASCGYAQPRMSDTFGVVRDMDRSALAPVQVFTPRNSRGFRFTRALPVLPDGFRANFRDAALDYEERQVVVARPGFAGVPRVTEQITIEGLVSEADVTARAVYDLRQAELRGTFYTLDAPAEAIVCQRGDLVGVTHDALEQWMGQGRIIGHAFDGAGDVTAIELDTPVSLSAEPEWLSVPDVLAVGDVLLLGVASRAIVRGPAGPGNALALTVSSGSSAWLTFAAPQTAADMPEGALVVVGLTGVETLRLVVFDVQSRADLTATLTFVDEASELFAA